MTPKKLRDSGLMPDGYELLPIPVIEDLVEAGYAVYPPAVGGSGDAVHRIVNSAQSANNVLTRYRKRKQGKQHGCPSY